MAFRTNKTPVLQEKSASGSVATFNTALAMPLPSCNIAVNAWQEGSGNPSPSNVRPIHGFSEVNATRAGKNLIDSDTYYGDYKSGDSYIATINDFIGIRIPLGAFLGTQITISMYFKVGSGAANVRVRANINGSWVNGNEIGGDSEGYTTLTVTPTSYSDYANITFGSGGGSSLEISKVMIEVSDSRTTYEAYIGNTYTIQLGQEVYGAEVDVVNGVAHVTHKVVDMGNLNLFYTAPNPPTYPYGYFRLLPSDKAFGVSNMMCEYYKVSTQPVFTNDLTIIGTRTSYTCYIIDSQHNDEDLVNGKAPWLDGYKLVYKLYTPFDIQLTPTQIETLIGNNTIFADTGDVDLTFKDLDIAKRGNFREVFKLPS